MGLYQCSLVLAVSRARGKTMARLAVWQAANEDSALVAQGTRNISYKF
jgi:hypothetical protein